MQQDNCTEFLRTLTEDTGRKGLKECDYTIYMDMNDNDYIMTLPKRGLKTRSYNADMNEIDLEKLSNQNSSRCY